MLTRTHITLLLALAVVTWALSLWALGIAVTWEYSKPFTITVTVLSALAFLFENWLWGIKICKGWLVNRPNLNGTWKVVIHSDWIDPETKQSPPPIACMMAIRQTYSRFSARLFSAESASYVVASKIEQQNDGVFQLFGTYQNTPDIALRGKRSEIHYGAFLFEIRGEPPKSLVGHYWTDRGTKGSIVCSDHIQVVISSYEEGVERFRLPPR